MRRPTIRSALAALSALIMVPIVSEFAIEYARQKGLYADPAGTVGRAMTSLTALAQSHSFQLLVVGVCCFTTGVWADWLLSRIQMERHFFSVRKKISPHEREALALRLEDLSQKIASLVGEFQGPIQKAWWEGSHVAKAEVEGKLLERYAHRYQAQVWAAIAAARKCVSIERGEYWRISHGARGEHDLAELCQFLTALAADVRNSNPTLPLRHRPPEIIDVLQGESSHNQSTEGTATETQP